MTASIFLNQIKSCSGSDAVTVANENYTIEVYLNKPIQIGCFQVKLKFNKELTTPIEIRLYKQKKNQTPSMSSSACDKKIDFFSPTDKYELLYGPVDISEFLDLSCSKTYAITISSDKLLETRSNLFFLSLKQGATTGMGGEQQQRQSISNMLNKINITIRKYKRTNLTNETIERGLMLLRSEFFNKLLTHVTESTSSEDLLNILDLMSWILFNHSSMESKTLKELVGIMKTHLKKFLTVLYLHGNRSTSRKATLLLNFFLSKNVDRDRLFGSLLLQHLLDWLRLLPYFESSASMNWFFILLHRVMAICPNKTYESCMQMLTTLSKGTHRKLIFFYFTYQFCKSLI